MKKLTMILAVAGLIGIGNMTEGAITNIDTTISYATIQDAIDAAAAGHTISIDPGTYNENLVINSAADKAITLVGAGNGSDSAFNTIIQGVSANSDAIHIVHGGTAVGQRVLLSNLRVTGGQGAGNLGLGVELGCSGDISHITFDNVASVGNQGHGIALNHVGSASDITVSQCLLSENSGLGFRVPTSLASLDGLTIVDSTIADNDNIGVLVYSSGATNVTIGNTNFSKNASGVHTGGDLVLSGFNGDLTLSDITFDSDNAEAAIRVSGSHDGGTPRLPISDATIAMTNVTIGGTQASCGTYPSAAIVISRLKDLTPSGITFDNVAINSSAPTGLFVGTVTDSVVDLAGEVAFNGTFSDFAIELGQHGNSSSYAHTTGSVNATGLGLTEADVWDFNDDPLLGNAVVLGNGQVIPEPAAAVVWLLGGVILFFCAAVRRRSKK